MSVERTTLPVDDPLTLQLSVVTHELAVADDELAAQQREIDDLVARESDARRTVSALTHSVPVPVLVTDPVGGVVEANLAAATLLGVPLARLVRKPVQAFVAPEARGAVRGLVSRAASTGSATGTVTLVPRHAPTRAARVVLTAGGRRPDGRASLSWVFVDGPPADDAALKALAGLTALSVGDTTVHDLLTRISTLATGAVPGGSWCSVVLGDPADPDELAADSEQAQRMDGAQWRTGQGPALTAYADGTPVVAPRLEEDPRWPALAALAGTLPARGALAVPIRAQDTVRGVLTVYGQEEGTLDSDTQLDRALVFAHAAAAVLQDVLRVEELRSTAENLKIAMSSRATIEQAKGLIAGWLGCTVEDAFATLSRVSMDRNVKLRDIAALAVADPSRHDLQPLLAEAWHRLRQERQRSSS
ncbi:ANTAR domain-containing protein [Kineococcus aurantiacus]|uniref:PAS domain-containing protein n=1 Tax=Kineococcus aurantiacus TaxID=37633 RepID=A0A7Y9DN90_9ACTN|nr:ANTAR domain-containing protein [Kineococcus aurantiacus]NYD23748.1 PAS domain-containing protein [Kineococcus aurantiacus]